MNHELKEFLSDNGFNITSSQDGKCICATLENNTFRCHIEEYDEDVYDTELMSVTFTKSSDDRFRYDVYYSYIEPGVGNTKITYSKTWPNGYTLGVSEMKDIMDFFMVKYN